MENRQRSQGGRPHLPAAWALAVLLLAGVPASAHAQIFLAARPNPEFTVGPLFVRARLDPSLEPPEVSVRFGLVVPPTVSGARVEQDLYLLWPGVVDGEQVEGPADAKLRRDVESHGFQVVREGRLPLAAVAIWGGQRRPRELLAGGAPFVIYEREAGSAGQASRATWIRIPWSPRLVDRTWFVELRMRPAQLLRQKKASWLENLVWGERHTITLTFHEIRGRAAAPLYLTQRDRAVRLAEEPSQLSVSFADSDHLKIQEIYPLSSQRRASEGRRATEIVSLYLDPSEGLRPQILRVDFGYFTGWKSWAPVLFAAAFFVLGNLAGPLVKLLVRRVGARLEGKIHFGPRDKPVERQAGTVISRDTLARIAPGVTTHDEVLRLCGPDPEEHEHLATPERRVLVYRGRTIAPRRGRRLGWVATVNRWDADHHEVEITLDRGVVQDVQARIRRTRLERPEGGP